MAKTASTIGLEQKFVNFINLEAGTKQLETELKQLKKSAPKNFEEPLKSDEAESLILHYKNIKKVKAEIKESEKLAKEAKLTLEELLKILDGKDVLLAANGVNYLVSYSGGKLKHKMVFTPTETEAVV